ncbi:MAG TPA: hypothetical protein VK828_06585 [Terriglobales bacterium]|jgi:hypothetical protein|nr:hypothetical protein [Terriglobales bacterium]
MRARLDLAHTLLSDEASRVSTLISFDPARWMGQYVRIGPTKPDGTPHPSAGKTGKVEKLLSLGGKMLAVVEVESDFILVYLESPEGTTTRPIIRLEAQLIRIVGVKSPFHALMAGECLR